MRATDTVVDPLATLHSTDTIRDRATTLLTRAREGHSHWFTVDDDAIGTAVSLVADVTRARYPDLDVPFHSRWRHFEAAGVDRVAGLAQRMSTLTVAERISTRIDLAVVSVLLDAGAGPQWHFDEPDTDIRLTRSEGLGVASFHAFTDGLFSSADENPLRVDAAGLRALTADQLARAFQVTADNPLVGVEGRLGLLHELADVLEATPSVFGEYGRPGGLGTVLTSGSDGVRAADILELLLTYFAPIWPSANRIDDRPLGDCWRHSDVGGDGVTAGWMPFHKLSQWLTYSLLEPFGDEGITVTGLEYLTALPEYRNGGLLLDTGVLVPVPADWSTREWQVDDEFIVEWRALTVALLDELAPLVCAELGLDAAATPLACILEGGTWAAGRAAAAQRRQGLPPLTIISDGTVF